MFFVPHTEMIAALKTIRIYIFGITHYNTIYSMSYICNNAKPCKTMALK